MGVLYKPVRCEDDWSPVFDDVSDTVPEEAASFRIHPSGRLILQVEIINRKYSKLDQNEIVLLLFDVDNSWSDNWINMILNLN